jgi:predicted permease
LSYLYAFFKVFFKIVYSHNANEPRKCAKVDGILTIKYGCFFLGALSISFSSPAIYALFAAIFAVFGKLRHAQKPSFLRSLVLVCSTKPNPAKDFRCYRERGCE